MSKSLTREKLEKAIIEGNVPQIVMQLLTLALEMKVSDIHMEPRKYTVLNRFRVDGTLQEIIEYPSSVHSAVISRIKILSNMKIDEQRKPQDGRLQMMTESRQSIELRVSTLPTIHGEKVCMRLQDKNKSIPTFEQMGINGNNLRFLEKTIRSPNGIFMVSGPTGSGKTTTLYAALNILNKPTENIMTIEDPVEYEMEGLSQSQVQADIGYDFASGLRTALRQDPDIIMVGEIRDQETIEIAIKAALTGHMVLSTIHTNSAAATFTRVIDMGIKPYKVTAAMRTIEAQRLVKRLCKHCKEAYKPEGMVLEDLQKEMARIHPTHEFQRELLNDVTLYRAVGCDECQGKGYAGRCGVYEVMMLSREIEQLVLAGKSEHEIEDMAISQGMVTILQDSYIKAIMGDTSIDEVMKITGGGH
ncbi:MAG: GspE/PulE family protein [Candidatus Peregrinibacteria bacterium]